MVSYTVNVMVASLPHEKGGRYQGRSRLLWRRHVLNNESTDYLLHDILDVDVTPSRFWPCSTQNLN